MNIVYEFIFAVAFIAFLPVAFFFNKNKRKDDTVHEEESFQQTVDQLKQTSAKLYCAGCDEWFEGPLDPEMGCPKCHTTGLVITEPEYNKLNLK